MRGILNENIIFMKSHISPYSTAIKYNTCFAHKHADCKVSVVANLKGLSEEDDDGILKIYVPWELNFSYDLELKDKMDLELSDWLKTLSIKFDTFHQLCKDFTEISTVYNPVSISLEQRIVYVKFIITFFVFDDIYETLCVAEKTKDMALRCAQQLAAILCGEDSIELQFDPKEDKEAVAMVTLVYNTVQGVVSEMRKCCDTEVVKYFFNSFKTGFKSSWIRELEYYASSLETASLDLYDDIKTDSIGFIPCTATGLTRLDAMTVAHDDPFLRMCSAYSLNANQILSFFKEREAAVNLQFSKVAILMKQGLTEPEAIQRSVYELNQIMVTLTTMYKYADQGKKATYMKFMKQLVSVVEFHLTLRRYGWYVDGRQMNSVRVNY
ncbi:hypothetical protein HDE_14579 [Halotydeus destructor]|nr:hypothetical protein HDE_14579 [Halotydeus destructor]